MSTRDTIHDRLCEIKVIDTHEHLWDESYRLEHPGDWTGLFFQYGITALQMAGMTLSETDELYAETTPYARKWAIFSRYFPLARNTAYLRSVLIAIRDLYGIEQITSETMQELSTRIKSAVKPGFQRWVLAEKAGIDYALVNCFDRDAAGDRYPARTWGDTALLHPVLYADELIHPAGYALLSRLTGVDTASFDGWLAAIDAYFAQVAEQCLAVKIALGYGRELYFDAGVSRAEAERLYIRHRATPLSYAAARPMGDYIFHHVLRRAADYRLPLQFHTGIYSGANYMNAYRLRDNVRDLALLAIAHPECRFIVMHIAYPFQNELVLAARQITNLYAEMSWAWIVDPDASAHFLAQMLEAAPLNKLLGFGGDYALVENAYGHLQLARQAVAHVLASMVAERGWDLDQACEAGWYLLHGAAARLLGEPPAVWREDMAYCAGETGAGHVS